MNPVGSCGEQGRSPARHWWWSWCADQREGTLSTGLLSHHLSAAGHLCGEHRQADKMRIGQRIGIKSSDYYYLSLIPYTGYRVQILTECQTYGHRLSGSDIFRQTGRHRQTLDRRPDRHADAQPARDGVR